MVKTDMRKSWISQRNKYKFFKSAHNYDVVYWCARADRLESHASPLYDESKCKHRGKHKITENANIKSIVWHKIVYCVHYLTMKISYDFIPYEMFWPDENSIEQCFAAHIVQGCRQYCSTLLHLIAGQFRLINLFSIVDNLEQCGQHNIVQCCFHQARTGCAFFAVYPACRQWRR